MDYREMYRKKLCTLSEVYDMIEDNTYISCINNSADPRTFFSHMHEMKGKTKGIVVQSGNITLIPEVFNEEYADVVSFVSTFYGARYKKIREQESRVSYIPVHLRNAGNDRIYRMRSRGENMNIFVCSVSPMDKHGFFTTATNATAGPMFAKFADKVIVEVNESCPRTFGDTLLHISQVDAIYHSEDNKILYYPEPEPSDTDIKIGRAIAEMVNDGDTIQLGIGGIPTACAMGLSDKRDLGVHTEMFNDGLMYLCRVGAITNRKKNFFKNKIVTTFSAGTKELMDYIDNNPNILHLAVDYTNSPSTISRNDNFVSVNTALSVDLMGQCCSEAIQTHQISGTGGQTETAIGAKESRGGKSIIAIHSTREIKQRDGSKKRISNINAIHPEGSVISLSRNDVDFVCTEYGFAALRGATLRERARALIDIAHPDYRDSLEEEAKRLWLL